MAKKPAKKPVKRQFGGGIPPMAMAPPPPAPARRAPARKAAKGKPAHSKSKSKGGRKPPGMGAGIGGLGP